MGASGSQRVFLCLRPKRRQQRWSSHSHWRDTFRISVRWCIGDASPSKATWLVFFVTEVAWAIAMRGEGESCLLNATCAVGCLCIFILSCWKGGGASWSPCEKISASAGICVLLVGVLSQDCHVTVKACLLAYVIGLFPTARAALQDPKGESLAAWSAWLMGSIPYLCLSWGDWTSSMTTGIVVASEETIMVLILLCSRTAVVREPAKTSA